MGNDNNPVSNPSTLVCVVATILAIIIAATYHFLFNQQPKKNYSSQDAANTTAQKQSEVQKGARDRTATTNTAIINNNKQTQPAPVISTTILKQSMEKSILLFDIDDHLFKTLYGDDEKWNCQFHSLSSEENKMPPSKLNEALVKPGLCCVVVDLEDDSSYWNTIIDFYKSGGFVIWFGIYGVYAAPDLISMKFGVQWRFSGYTRYEYELTNVGKQLLGTNIVSQAYSKANLLSVPIQDRILTPKVMSMEEFLEDYDEEEHEEAKEDYSQYKNQLENQVPLALHCSIENTSTAPGGKVAYLGFVNNDDNIPLFVRALCTNTKIPA